MAKEIERKFLVSSDGYKSGMDPFHIRQGFISTNKDSIVRVRVQGDKSYLTIKGSGSGITRIEYEYEIPPEDAHAILEELCRGPIIEKYRYLVHFDEHLWEVDEFMNENAGLVIAEIELTTEDEAFSKPPWVGEEVTGDPKYYNANLIAHPYCDW